MSLFGKKDKTEEKKTNPDLPARKQGNETAREVMPSGGQEAVKDQPVVGIKLPKGDDAQSYGVIIGPHITEKAGLMETQNKYVFRVSKNANKHEVKRAIEKLYKVAVENVRMVNLPSKTRFVGRTKGVRPGFKKAVVKLKEGNRIELTQ